MQAESEAALIRDAREGSAAAYTELVAAYRESLFRFLLTRAASYADAEDALQDTLINAYRYLHSYDERWRFSTWLYRIAINNVDKAQPGSAADVDDLANREAGPLEQCIAASNRRNLWLAARRLLKDEVYTAMWLRYVEDMSIGDIAAVLERSTAWTKVNLMRGRQALDAEFNQKPDKQEDKAYG